MLTLLLPSAKHVRKTRCDAVLNTPKQWFKLVPSYQIKFVSNITSKLSALDGRRFMYLYNRSQSYKIGAVIVL